MSRRTPTCLGCLGGLLVAVATSLFGLYQWDRQTSVTAAVPATVVRVADRGTRQGGDRHTVVDYRYTVGEATYEARAVKRGPNRRPAASRPDYVVGEPAIVCHNPGRPRVAEIFPRDYRCPDSRLPQPFRRRAR